MLFRSLCKTALDFLKEQGKNEDRKLDRQKFEFDAAQAAMAQLPKLKAISASKSLSEPEKLLQVRLALFGCAPE